MAKGNGKANESTAVLDPPDEAPVSEAVEAQQESTESAEAAEEAKAPEAPTEPLPEHVREHYEAIRAKEREVRALEDEYIDAKEAASEAKKAFDKADKRLRDMIAHGCESLPLFDGQPAKAQKTPKRVRLIVPVGGFEAFSDHDVTLVDPDGDVAIGSEDDPIYLNPDEFVVIEWNDPAAAAAPVESDEWRKAPFAELGLTAKQNELFEAAGVTTIGQLEDLRADIASAKAVWPKGIGPTRITDIEDRVISWLDKNRDKFGEPIQPHESNGIAPASS